MALCNPTPEAMAKIKRLNCFVIEVGAGDGYWIRAMQDARIYCLGYDIAPGHEVDVIKGDHVKAIPAAKNRSYALLAVWPPDGDEVQRWITEHDWKYVILCGATRFNVGDTLGNYFVHAELAMPPGDKGGSDLVIYKRRG